MRNTVWPALLLLASPLASEAPSPMDRQAAHREEIEREIAGAVAHAVPSAPMHLTPCVAGMAGPYPCDGIDLLEFMPVATFGAATTNSGWGWTDTLGTPDTGDDREYYLLGLNNGTAFIDITDPENPLYLGKLPSHNGTTSLWRDVRVYQNHAYVVSEASGHGMQVFDLTQLRSVPSPPATFTETAHYNKVSNTHTISINEESGYAYLVGTDSGSPPVVTCSGALHMVNLAVPASPTFAGCYDDGIYIHENQCFVYHGPDVAYTGHEICLASRIYDDDFAVIDVSNHGAPVLLDTIRYQPIGTSSLPHQAWFTEDHRYILLNDEGDESSSQPTRTWIFDALDLDALVTAGSTGAFVHATAAHDHNLYVRGDYVTQSNYRAGLRILRLTNLADAELTEVAYFDVYPADNNRGYSGSWNHYPYFESGVIPITHIESGLFLVRPTEICFVPLETPTALDAQAAGANQIHVEWSGTGEAGATYELQRAPGGCSGVFETVSSGLAAPEFDDSVSGDVVYGYRVREIRAGETCFSPYSACVTASTTGDCTQAPTFAGVVSATDLGLASCSVELTWNAATPHCGSDSRYSIFRSSDPDFVPMAANRIAQGVQGLQYTDATPHSGAASYYIVRAADISNGAEDQNLALRTATATGPPVDGTFSTGAEEGDPPLDTLSSAGAEVNAPEHAGWHIDEKRFHTGSQSFYSTSSSNLCVSLEAGPLTLTAGQASQLSFWTIWDIEATYDGGIVEISTNGGGSWTTLTPAGGYPGSITHDGNACSALDPPPNRPAFSNENQLVNWQQKTVDLAAYSGQAVKVSWRYGSDSGVNETGWYVDDIEITHAQVPGACTQNAIFIERHEGGGFGAWSSVSAP